MAKKPTTSPSPFVFKPVILDQKSHEKRRTIRHLPVVHQTETLQKFFGSTVDHLFDPGKGRTINGYIGQRPLWYDPEQDYYVEEATSERQFYQLEASMVSKNDDGSVSNLLFYPDLINQLRFQGAITDNHHRLFEQDMYSWCPPVDLDKLINFRQYIWLHHSETFEVDDAGNQTGDRYALQVRGPKRVYEGNGVDFVFYLPGYTDDLATTEEANFYDLAVLRKRHITVHVDGNAVGFNYVESTATKSGEKFITLDTPPAIDAIIEIWVYSDFENLVLGKDSVDPVILGGHQISSGQRIQILNDKNTDYKPADVFIVEGVGRAIELIKEENHAEATTTPEYMVMERGAFDKNPWSMCNRWFHVDTLSKEYDRDYLMTLRATRPILEYKKDLELFNYGSIRRSDVDIVSENIADIIAHVVANNTDLTIDSVRLRPAANDKVRVGNSTTYVAGVRIMLRNTIDPEINDKIFAITSQDGKLVLVLETDGLDPSGNPVYGELFKVRMGSSANKEFHWDGLNWIESQSKSEPNQTPLFNLYDMNGVSLADTASYPKSNFAGSRLFSYQVDEGEARARDIVLGLPLVHDNRGEISFENFLGTESFTYILNGNETPIQGFYFHKTNNPEPSLETFSNDWYKSDTPSRQFVVDRYVSDGVSRLFKISQEPVDSLPGQAPLEVWRGRMNDDKNFSRTLLTENVDYFRKGREILVTSVSKNDTIEIRSFSYDNLPSDATGFYELPLNLRANPDNGSVTTISKGDFYSHFSDIMKQQSGFTGAEYAINNWRDTSKELNKGSHIVQHSAGLLKTMLLASESQLDMTSAIRFSESEYVRFKNKFHQKILDFSTSSSFVGSTTDVWIDAALTDINLGKNKSFPFFSSKVGIVDKNSHPTFIPATPSFLGVYPLYVPELVSTTLEDGSDVHFVKGHDGSWTQGMNLECAQVLLALEQRIYLSVPVNIRERERPVHDWQEYCSDQFRRGVYSYDEYLSLLRPNFERWCVTTGNDYRVNDDYDISDPWTYNWSSIPAYDGSVLPGHWRGIYEKYFGTQRPDLTPWEMLGFTSRPSWWDSRYGPGPYTSDNMVLWLDLERGYIHDGPRKAASSIWARPGLTQIIPVDEFGDLKNPYEAGIAITLPLAADARAEWKWGDVGPVEQEWRRSSAFSFAVAMAAYLMRPAQFVELGWDTENTVKLFAGEAHEQWMNTLTMSRPRHGELRVYGEQLEDLSIVSRIGVQQWVGDLLISRSSDISSNFANKVRNLEVQLAYKVGGFTDSANLVVASDAFGRIPAEDLSVNLYRSPSIREESYSGVAIEWTGKGFRIYGYDKVNPYFKFIQVNTEGSQIKIGGSGRSDLVPNWQVGVYYTVNLTVKYGEKYYRCEKTHTSSSQFEVDYWLEVARPQYADGTDLLWALDTVRPETVGQISYGNILKTPQDVADFMNGYSRYLESRGWIFDRVSETDFSLNDWQDALKGFITWSQRDDLAAGDVISLSPGCERIKFKTEHGSIQPVEQIIGGAYAIVDQLGHPIQESETTVMRFDGEITVTSNNAGSGIYGLRLFVSEVEHVVVLNNKTIFNDTIFSPLLGIQQPRLRLQGFRTVAWNGRIDAPGFVISNNTLTPNFEKAADDFRRFFDVESMENKALQDRARANNGYQEKEYLNNLLLSPTNQFEFYQGMVQQKGSPTSMRRLLRSNFIRHNKGLQLLEEWAFRVGDYGGSEMQPSLEIQINQSDFKHNPQLFEFNQLNVGNNPATQLGVTQISDFVDSQGALAVIDERWVWRPDSVNINWPVRTSQSNTNADLPTAGFVKLDEVKWTAPRQADFDHLITRQLEKANPVKDGDRVWCYGIDDPENVWKTVKYFDTSFGIDKVFSIDHNNGTLVCLADDAAVNEEGVGELSTITCSTDPDAFYLALPSQYREVDGVALPETVIIEGMVGSSDLNGKSFIPTFKGQVSVEITGASATTPIMDMVPEAGTHVRSITVQVHEPFSESAVLQVGTEIIPDEFIKAPDNQIQYPDVDVDGPAHVVVAPRNTYYVMPDVTTVDVNLVRVGRADPCDPTIVEWFYKRASDASYIKGGDLTYSHPDELEFGDYSHYEQVVKVPINSGDAQTVSIKVVTNGVAGESVSSIEVKRYNTSGVDHVDLTQVGLQEFNCASGLNSLYPYKATEEQGLQVVADLYAPERTGRATITIEYFYTQGFELLKNEDGIKTTVPSFGGDEGGQIFTWIPTSYPNLNSGTIPTNVWKTGDLIEVMTLTAGQGGNGGWAVMEYNGTGWSIVRVQNQKIDSDLLTNAAIYDTRENSLKMVLQLFDPAKGYIPGIADRELYYKLDEDPAIYLSDNQTGDRYVWGSEQVGRLWWDLNTVRYLDYEIYDTLEGGISYRWKHWGRLAPGCNIDIYEWTRSPVPPTEWAQHVNRSKNLPKDQQPTGEVDSPERVPFIQKLEWNSHLQRDETVYYFWVRNVAKVPSLDSRRLTAIQVANIISNPVANDIPYFAVIDHSKIVLGGIKQFVADKNTVLKLKWKQSVDIDTPHHKQWLLLREQDERNTIDDRLWDKMRDSLVGWDSYTDESGNLQPKQVPDPKLPVPQQVGNLVRPRQAWFPAEPYADGGLWPNREARSTFVEALNSILSRAPYLQQWHDWRDVFDMGEALPSDSQYVATALDLSDLKLMAADTLGSINLGDQVLIENTVELDGFWSLWQCFEQNGVRDFKLVDCQKWRLQEDDLWETVDWYDQDWSAADFPSYRFTDLAARDASRPLDYTLLKGTLVQVDNTLPGDGMWVWYVFSKDGYREVARKNGTLRLKDSFARNDRVKFGPDEVASILARNITPSSLAVELGDVIKKRDGSRELEWIINSLRTTLFDTLQKNELFFHMVKSAFKVNQTVDWAFKTSFLYLGGYSENLRQSPVAFKDQIDNVVAYLEEVKPYHVKIREYVRRLSYGPDTANLVVTDFDKPVYLDRGSNPPKHRKLDVTVASDAAIMETTRPWKDWYQNRNKENYNPNKWDSEWNPVRRARVKVSFDRVACGTIKGWDTSPWDAPHAFYTQTGGTIETLSSLSEKYRAEYIWDETTGTFDTSKKHSDYYAPGPNVYNDSAVDTISDRNALVRAGIVRPENPGSIVVVRSDLSRWMWTGKSWIQFHSSGWDQDLANGAASRIEESYEPSASMAPKGSPGLISGCDFGGTVITDSFNSGGWDMFEWDSTGWSSEFADRTGMDVDTIDGNTVLEEGHDIAITGNKFAQPKVNGGRPEEQVQLRGRDSLIITVMKKTNGVQAPELRMFKNQIDGWEQLTLSNNNMSVEDWDQPNKTLIVRVPGGNFTLHDPNNPTEEFLDKVKLSQGYYSSSSHNLSMGTKTFNLRDIAGEEFKTIPAGIIGDGVRVVIENAANPNERMIGTLSWTDGANGNELDSWNGSIKVDVEGYVGDTPTDTTSMYQKWNIIPLEAFNQSGVIWVGSTRITYTAVEAMADPELFSLKNVHIGASSLAGITVTSTMDTIDLTAGAKIYDGSILNRFG